MSYEDYLYESLTAYLEVSEPKQPDAPICVRPGQDQLRGCVCSGLDCDPLVVRRSVFHQRIQIDRKKGFGNTVCQTCNAVLSCLTSFTTFPSTEGTVGKKRSWDEEDEVEWMGSRPTKRLCPESYDTNEEHFPIEPVQDFFPSDESTLLDTPSSDEWDDETEIDNKSEDEEILESVVDTIEECLEEGKGIFTKQFDIEHTVKGMREEDFDFEADNAVSTTTIMLKLAMSQFLFTTRTPVERMMAMDKILPALGPLPLRSADFQVLQPTTLWSRRACRAYRASRW
jgi:hypothetical protein